MDWWNHLESAASRNWDEDEEEDVGVDRETFKLEWTHSSLVKHCCSKLIIGNSVSACVFLNVQFPQKELIGTIVSKKGLKGKSKDVEKHCNSCGIYKLLNQPDDFLAIAEGGVDADLAYEFASLLLNSISYKRVFVLSGIQESMLLKVKEKVDFPSLRKLVTNTARINNLTPEVLFLESPLLVEQLPAALLTHCHLRNEESYLYLTVEEALLNVDSVQAFEQLLPILSSFPVQQNKKYHDLLRLKGRANTHLYL